MDKITTAKKEYRLQTWQKLIAEQKKSGMTIIAWCAQNDVSKSAYYYWLRQIREAAMDNLPVSVSCPEDMPLTFKKLEIQRFAPDAIEKNAAIVMHMPTAVLEIHNGINQQTLEAVLRALTAVC